ncbi:hypothetical protein T492DRAFT_857558, partial [Pavlovales sp. CCMP2436]
METAFPTRGSGVAVSAGKEAEAAAATAATAAVVVTAAAAAAVAAAAMEAAEATATETDHYRSQNSPASVHWRAREAAGVRKYAPPELEAEDVGVPHVVDFMLDKVVVDEALAAKRALLAASSRTPTASRPPQRATQMVVVARLGASTRQHVAEAVPNTHVLDREARAGCATSACRGRVVGCELPVGQLVQRLESAMPAAAGFLVSNCDIALSPEDVVTLFRANRAAQGSGNVCFGAGKTPTLDIPQGRRRTSTDYTARATSRAAATTLERLWEPLGAAIGHDKLFNGQLRINVSDILPHLDQRLSLARLLWKLGLILHCRIMVDRSTGANVTIVISEGSLAAPLCLTRGVTCYVDGVNSGPCTISLPIGLDGEAIRVQCVHCALCCLTDAREALHALEGAALSSPLPAVRVCMARGARVAARAAGELNVTFGVDSNQGVLETALDISRRFAECSEQRQVQGLAARKSADPSEWQGWKVKVQTRESAFAQLERASRKRCSRGLMVQVSVSRATSSFECPDLPLIPRATPDELKAAAKRKRDDPDAFAARKAK